MTKNQIKLKTIIFYLDTYGEELTQTEAKMIRKRLKELGIKQINLGCGIVEL